MPDLHLRFANVDEARAVLQSVGLVPADGIFPADGSVGGTLFALDLLFGDGTIRLPLSSADTPTSPVTEFAALPGCHVNLRWRSDMVPEAIAPFRIQPDTPAVCWA
jgi:hypothetical protein